jgi:hypothetical protein
VVLYQSHAEAILEKDFPAAAEEIERAIADVEVPITEIIGSGGGQAKGTQRMRRSLGELGWKKINFEIKKIVNGVEREAISHEIDHVKGFDKGVIALEIEWKGYGSFQSAWRTLEGIETMSIIRKGRVRAEAKFILGLFAITA